MAVNPPRGGGEAPVQSEINSAFLFYVLSVQARGFVRSFLCRSRVALSGSLPALAS